MGVLEAVNESKRRYTAERAERIAAEQAALAAKQAEAAEKERNADLNRRREEARQNARLGYIVKVKPLDAAAIAANEAQSALDAALADPASATVEQLFTLWSTSLSARAAHTALRASVSAYEFIATHPGEQLPARYIDRAPKPTFVDLLSQVVAARAAAAAKAVQVPAEVFAKADLAGEQAAKAVE
jgi:hypothetical protein